jgi:hypothetical protein
MSKRRRDDIFGRIYWFLGFTETSGSFIKLEYDPLNENILTDSNVFSNSNGANRWFTSRRAKKYIFLLYNREKVVLKKIQTILGLGKIKECTKIDLKCHRCYQYTITKKQEIKKIFRILK